MLKKLNLNLKWPTYSSKRLRKKLEKERPACRRFVSSLWSIPENAAEPRSIEVRNGIGDGKEMAAACASKGKIRFWAGFFHPIPRETYDRCQRPDRILVHEMTHIAIPGFDSSDSKVRKCLKEGIAMFSENHYSLEYPLKRKILINQIALFSHMIHCASTALSSVSKYAHPAPLSKDEYDPYLFGYRFINALFHAGYTPAKILKIVKKNLPDQRDFFFPLNYLDRVGLSYEINPKSKPPDVKKWIETAIKHGLEKTVRTNLHKQSCSNLEVDIPSNTTTNNSEVQNLRGILSEKLQDLAMVLVVVSSIPVLYPIGAFLELIRTTKEHLQFLKSSKKGSPQHLLPDAEEYGSRFIAVLDEKLGSREKVLSTLDAHPPTTLFEGNRFPEIMHIMDPEIYLRIVKRTERI